MARTFHFKKSIPVPYNIQGYIYFTSRVYSHLPPDRQQEIFDLCVEIGGGDYYKALYEFVTTDAGATAICEKHHLSRSTLVRLVREYYTCFRIEP